jgi:hypothetical protein
MLFWPTVGARRRLWSISSVTGRRRESETAPSLHRVFAGLCRHLRTAGTIRPLAGAVPRGCRPVRTSRLWVNRDATSAPVIDCHPTSTSEVLTGSSETSSSPVAPNVACR